MEYLEKINVLCDDEIKRIHDNTLRILENTGMYIYDGDSLKLFADAGLDVNFNRSVVKFPRAVVERALQSVPKEIKLFTQEGDLAAELGKGKCHTASGHNAIYVLNGDSRRGATKDDVGKFALLADYLPDIDIVGIEAIPQDVEPEASFLHAVDAVYNSTEKHLFCSPENALIAQCIFDITKVVIDSEDLQQRASLTSQVSPTSPLTWERGAMEVLVETARAGVPLCILSQPFTGVTSPYTLAGLLTVNNAETLSGIVICQLINPGSPVIYGSGWSTFDMRTANVLIGSPETVLMRMAGSQIAEFYRMPYHTIAPDTDAHAMDEQLAWEKCATAWGAFLAHSDLIVNGGMFSTGLTVSFEQLILDNELFSYIKRVSRGILVSDETLALDIIEKLGPKGDYLAEEHTLKHLGSFEHWEPELSVRQNYENWRKGGKKDIIQRAHEKVNLILKSHKRVELSGYKKKEVGKIIKNFEECILKKTRSSP